MEAVKARAGWKGSLADVFQQLRTDPRYFYRTRDELLLRTRELAKRIDPKLVRLFGTLPRLPYGVEPTPAAMAPDATTGFYYPGAEDGSRAGTYWVNTYKPETRPRWEMVPLTLHEAVPGPPPPGLARRRAARPARLPPPRATTSAFGEGWALYCGEPRATSWASTTTRTTSSASSTYEMWRAVRLVVDTGMHAKGWTRAAGDRLLPRELAADGAGRHRRGRPLHRLAGPGAGLQDRPAEDPRAAHPRREGARRPLRRARLPRRGAAPRLAAAGRARAPHRRVDRRAAEGALRLTIPVPG